MKPVNPFKKWSIVWQVMEGDWEDLTIMQIAEVLGTTYGTAYHALYTIRKKTGYEVPHAHAAQAGEASVQNTVL